MLILCVVHAGIRRSNASEAGAAPMTSRELITALRQMRELERAQAADARAVEEALAAVAEDAGKDGKTVRLAEMRA